MRAALRENELSESFREDVAVADDDDAAPGVRPPPHPLPPTWTPPRPGAIFGATWCPPA